MIVPELDLFAWWAITISGGSIFLTIVSIYLYAGTRARRKKSGQATTNASDVVKNFVFVWVLLGLLIFYIVSIQIGSSVIFAAGNILVEVLLIVYLLKNKTKKSEETTTNDQNKTAAN
jgi:Flp pilus assembly protein TadB